MNTMPILSPLESLLKSRKMIAAVVGILVDVVIALVPALEPIRAEMILVFSAFVLAVIGGIAWEDGQALKAGTHRSQTK